MGHSDVGRTSLKNNKSLINKRYKERNHAYKYGKNQEALRYEKLSPKKQKIVDENTRRIKEQLRDRKFILITILTLALATIVLYMILNEYLP